MSSDRCRVLVALALAVLGCGPATTTPPQEAVRSKEDAQSSRQTAAEQAQLPVGLLRPTRLSPYDEIIKKQARRWGFDWRLITAQVFVESGFRERVRSHAGARGLMQIMPSTARWLGKDPALLVRPEDNIALGCYYDRKLYDVWKERGGWDRLAFMFASYNAGLGNVRKARRRAADPNTWKGIRPHLPEETREYVPRISRKYEEYKAMVP